MSLRTNQGSPCSSVVTRMSLPRWLKNGDVVHRLFSFVEVLLG
nr:MAG TPA: hypothetical protein [Caudoviricetes sp.]